MFSRGSLVANVAYRPNGSLVSMPSITFEDFSKASISLAWSPRSVRLARYFMWANVLSMDCTWITRSGVVTGSAALAWIGTATRQSKAKQGNNRFNMNQLLC